MLKKMDICHSDFWDNNATWNTDNPDFTPCFQKSVLALVPTLFSLVVGPIKIYNLCRQNKNAISWNLLHTCKVLVLVFLIAFELFTVIYELVGKDYEERPPIDIISPICGAVGFIIILVFVLLERHRGIRSSGYMFVFWFLHVLLGAVRLRTLIKDALDSNNPSLSIFVHYPLLVCGFILILFGDKRPASDTFQEKQNKCPEEDASYLSRITYWWCTGLVIKAMKRPLTHADVWSLKDTLKSEYVSSQFYHSRGDEGNEYSPSIIGDVSFIYKDGSLTPSSYSFKKRKHRHFILTLMLIYFQTFLWAAFIKLCHDVLVFIYPQVLRLMIRFVSSDEHVWRGYFYSSLMFFVALLQSILLHQYYHVNLSLGIRIRSTIIAAIYRKSLKLSSTARNSSTTGQIINLMSIDTQRFLSVVSNLHSLWSGLLQISIAFYFLWQNLGPSAFSGLTMIVLLMPINVFTTNKENDYQGCQMKLKDSRIKIMREILSGIKVLKLYAWESFFKDKISMTRKNELKMLKKGIYLKAFSTCVWDAAPFLMSLVTFSVYVMSSPENVLDVEKAFVSLALFSIMRHPLRSVPSVISHIVQAKVSSKRIQSFLNYSELDAYAQQKKDMGDNAIRIGNGSFSWDENSQILSDINIEIKENSLVAIVGSVGSGKSSLLYAMLGEMKKDEGSVNIKGSVSFVAQEAWIQNDTFQNNIIFNSTPRQSKYDKIVELCALKPDVDILPSGSATEIGEKGINLSGGQKQRVCLARAVYKDTDIYLLDDPLSSVDAEVGKHLFDKIIGPNGILSGKTRVLVTNGVEFLPQVDKIFVLDEGEIVEMGTFTDLMKRDGTFADYVNQYLKMEYTNPETWLKEEETIYENKQEILSLIRTTTRRRNSSSSKWQAFKRRQSMACIEERELLKTEKMNKKAKLVKKEKIETGKVKYSVFLAYLKAVGPYFCILSVFCHIFSCVAGIGTNIWLSDWSDGVQNANETLSDDQRNMRLSVYAVLGLTQGLTAYITSLVFLLGSLKAGRILHNGLLEGILHSPMRFFDATPCGRVLNRFGKDINTLDTVFPNNANQCLARFFSTLAIISVIGYSTPLFLIVVVPLFAFYCLVQRCYVTTSRQLKRLESVTWSPIYSHFEETIGGAVSIRAFNQERKYIQELQNRVDTYQMHHFVSVACNRWLAVRLELVGHCIIFFASLFAVLSRNDISPGMVGLSITYALDVTQTLTWLVRTLCSVETNIVAVERVKEYADIPSEAPWIIENQTPPHGWPRDGIVEFRNYETLYRDGLDNVLKGISFRIKAGEKIGIVGRTGSGKTSMMLALFRIIEAARGSILVDGINIATIGLHDLRSRLTVIPQDPILFSGTLRENIDPFGTHSDEELWSALEHAHLKSFIATTPEGLMFKCLEGGGNFSVGQRQLVCLARAFLRKTQILILDEATASVDLETDDLIQATIRENFRQCTVLTIAHRLNTVIDYTRILVLDKGNIKEFESPKILLKDKTSTFYGLASAAGLI